MKKQSKVDEEAVEREIRKAEKAFREVEPLREAGFDFSYKSFWKHDGEEVVNIYLKSPILKGKGLSFDFHNLYRERGRIKKSWPDILIDGVGGGRTGFLKQSPSSGPWYETVSGNMRKVLSGGDIQYNSLDSMETNFNQVLTLFDKDKLEQMTSWENPFDRDEWKNPMEVTREKNKRTASRLIRLGSQSPELRKHLKPVLDYLYEEKS